MFYLLVLYFSLYSQATIEKAIITKVETSSSCSGFIDDILSCKPNFCSIRMTEVTNERSSHTYKTVQKTKDNKCRIFISVKDANKTEVMVLDMSEQHRKNLSELIKFILTKKSFTISGAANCCAKNYKEIQYCSLKIDDRSFTDFADTRPYYDCKTSRMVFPLKMKEIDY